MKAKKIIYPEIHAQEWDSHEGHHVKLMTNLRKKYRGKWYLWLHMKHEIVSTDYLSVYSRFHSEVYNTLHLGVLTKDNIKTKLPGFHNEMMFELDEDQRSEEERLKSLLHV